MNTNLPSPYTRLDILITALWWSLLSGMGEGLVQRSRDSLVWQDQIRAALVINFLFFATLAALVIILNWRSTITRGQMVRITLVFAFLALYDCLPSFIPKYVLHHHFLNALIPASIAAWLLYLFGRRCMRFYSWSLPLLAILALWCIFIMPLRRSRMALCVVDSMETSGSSALSGAI